jgi:hypothetical protein
MKVIIIYLFGLLIVGCAVVPIKYPNVGEHALIKDSHDDFTLLLNQWTVLKRANHIDKPNMVAIGYMHQENEDFDELVAQCYHYEDKTREIRVTKKYWKKLSRLQQKYVIFKQLAMCDLDLTLSYKKDPYGTPVSMMYFDTIEEDTLKQNWGYYVNSLLLDYTP